MNFSRWGIHNPSAVVLIFILLSLTGIYSYKVLHVQDMPDLDLPVVSVSCTLVGANAQKMEADVAKPIEDAVRSLPGVRHLTTTVVDGLSTTMIEFNMDVSGQQALDDATSSVNSIRATLPDNINDPIIKRINLDGGPILAYSVSSKTRNLRELSDFVDYLVTRELGSIMGVAQVTRIGGINRQVVLQLDPVKLQSLKVSAAEISRQLHQVSTESPSGGIRYLGREIMIRTRADLDDLDRLTNLSITLPNGARLPLRQVASSIKNDDTNESIAIFNGQPVVAFEVSRGKGSGELTTAVDVREAIKRISELYPDIQIEQVFDFVTPIEDSFHGSIDMIRDGALLAIVVVWFFLRNGRATLIAAVALPLSILPAFMVMYYFGYTLNVVTLLALSLVIGILVDDAIVEIENIIRHQGLGKSSIEAAGEAAEEIGLAVIATTLTLVAVFLPTAFLSGYAGLFFKQFGVTASVAVLASLLVARLLTPMMAAYLLPPGEAVEHDQSPSMHKYLRWVDWCLAHRWIVLACSIGFFIVSLSLTAFIKKDFVPSTDVPQTQVSLQLSPGSSIEDTQELAAQSRTLIEKIPFVKGVYTTIGGGNAGQIPGQEIVKGDVTHATIFVLLEARAKRDLSNLQIEEKIKESLKQIPGARIEVGLGGKQRRYSFQLRSENVTGLLESADAVVHELKDDGRFGLIQSSTDLLRPQLSVTPQLDKMAYYGVTTSDIAETLRVTTQGDFQNLLPRMQEAQDQVPIVVRVPEEVKMDPASIRNLTVPSSRLGTGQIRLGQVASLTLESSQATITRYDGMRNVNIDVGLVGTDISEAVGIVNALKTIQELPADIQKLEIGDAKEMMDLFVSFVLSMLAGIFCIYMVLVLLFKDFFQPMTIMAAIPLCFGGGFASLLITDKSLSMPSLIGFLMLIGIATKNSILLVEYTIRARSEANLTRREAVINACKKRSLPIIMTSVAMAAGMAPIALGSGGADAPFRSPMAVAVIGGLFTSTLLSLFLIPVVYTLVDDLEQFCKRCLNHQSKDGPAAVAKPPN